MFDIGWSELLLIGIVALIVVGPRDLPAMFRTLGRFTAKARSMGREFQRAMDDAARESGAKDVADDLKAMTSKKNLGLDALDQAAGKFEKWKPSLKPAAPKSAPPAAAAATLAPKGPATQALAEKRAAEAAERKASLGAATARAPGATATARATRKTATAASEKPATKTAAKVAAKAPARPRARKRDA